MNTMFRQLHSRQLATLGSLDSRFRQMESLVQQLRSEVHGSRADPPTFSSLRVDRIKVLLPTGCQAHTFRFLLFASTGMSICGRDARVPFPEQNKTRKKRLNRHRPFGLVLDRPNLSMSPRSTS